MFIPANNQRFKRQERKRKEGGQQGKGVTAGEARVYDRWRCLLLGIGDGGPDGVLRRLAGLAERIVPRIEVFPILKATHTSGVSTGTHVAATAEEGGRTFCIFVNTFLCVGSLP